MPKRCLVIAAAFVAGIMLSACASTTHSGQGPAADGTPTGRLPQDVQPKAYTLELVVDPREPEFHGRVAIDLTVANETDHLWLHGTNLSVGEVYLESTSGARIEADYEQVLATGVSRIALGSSIAAGAYRLVIDYRAPFDPNLAGMFRVERGGDWYALAKSESIQARKAVPSFDEPGFKAPWDISLTVPAGYIAISISPVKRREADDNGFERVIFETSRPTSTYLLSLAVGPFERFKAEPLPPTGIRNHEIPLSGWARRGKAQELAFIMSLTRDMVEYFEDVTRTPYPYRKLDIVAAPDWPSGATELASAPTYLEEIILADGTPGPVQTRRIVGIHAHELAHMWFGDLVTPPWWDDLWLKEGFAVWGTPPAATAWNPNGGYELNAVRNTINGLRADALASARAVRQPIDRNEDIRSAYDGITYSKGSAVLRMAETFLGPQSWRDGLEAYFDEFEDKAADANDFSRVMGEAAGDAAFEASLNNFLNQNGAPLLRFERVESDNESPTLRISQQRYRPLGSPIDEDRDWITPVCIRHAGGSDCGLIEGDAGVISLSAEVFPDWFMPNADGAGYYRFALGDTDWSRLVANFETISASEALIAIDSATSGFEAGEIHSAALLDLIEIAAQAGNPEIRWEAANTLSHYHDSLYEQDDAARDTMRIFAYNLYRDQYTTLANATSDADKLFRQRLRGFLSTTGRDAALRAEFSAAAAAFVGMSGAPDPNALSADDFSSAAIIGVEDLGPQFLDAFFQNRDAINNTNFARRVINAAGLVDDAQYRETLLDLALLDTTEASEAFSLIASLMSNDDARDGAWDWINKNADPIASKVPAQWRRRVPALASHFCDSDRIADLNDFVVKKGDLFPGHERGVAQTRERIALCDALREAKSEEIATEITVRIE